MAGPLGIIGALHVCERVGTRLLANGHVCERVGTRLQANGVF